MGFGLSGCEREGKQSGGIHGAPSMAPLHKGSCGQLPDLSEPQFPPEKVRREIVNVLGFLYKLAHGESLAQRPTQRIAR